jgi:hypothetical protein
VGTIGRVDRGEFLDLNLRYKLAQEAWQRTSEKNASLARTGRLTSADQASEQRALESLQDARRDILLALSNG